MTVITAKMAFEKATRVSFPDLKVVDTSKIVVDESSQSHILISYTKFDIVRRDLIDLVDFVYADQKITLDENGQASLKCNRNRRNLLGFEQGDEETISAVFITETPLTPKHFE